MRVRILPSTGSQVVVGSRAPGRRGFGRSDRARAFDFEAASRLELAVGDEIGFEAASRLELAVGDEIGFESERRLGRVRRALAGALVLGAGLAAAGCAYDPSGEVAPVECRPSIFRIDTVTLPRTSTGAAQLALDLDGDGSPDNRLGRLHATLAGFFSDWRPDDHLTARLAGPGAAAVPWFLTVERCQGTLAVDLARGLDDDGDGRFTLAPGDDPAIGRDDATGAGRVAADGAGEVPLIGFTDGLGLATEAGWVAAHGLSVVLHPRDSEALDATIGVGLDLTDLALEPVAAFLTRHLGDSAIARALDADHDRVISVAELRASETVAALIAQDVDVAGADGLLDHVSIAFSIHATAYAAE